MSVSTVNLNDYMGLLVPDENIQINLIQKANQIQKETTVGLLEKTIKNLGKSIDISA
jgi:hypothetical protein